MVLRPLPVRDRQPAAFQRRAPGQLRGQSALCGGGVLPRAQPDALGRLGLELSRLAIDGEDKPLDAHFVTANFFSELGATGAARQVARPGPRRAGGRGAGGGPGPRLLAAAFWRRSAGRRKDPPPQRQPATVIGVAPREFSGLGVDIRTCGCRSPSSRTSSAAAERSRLSRRERHSVFMWGRMRPGLTPQVAEDDLGALAAELRRAAPGDIWEGESLPSEPGGYATPHRPRMYPVLALAAVFVPPDSRGGLRQPGQPSAGARGVEGPRDRASASPSARAGDASSANCSPRACLLALLGSGAGWAWATSSCGA